MYPSKRVYDYGGEQPAVLADRLWPRGISKVRLAGVVWCKEITPSTALRQWFHQDQEARYDAFCQQYRQELAQPQVQAALAALRRQAAAQGQLWLLTAAKDIDHSHIPILQAVLAQTPPNSSPKP